MLLRTVMRWRITECYDNVDFYWSRLKFDIIMYGRLIERSEMLANKT